MDFLLLVTARSHRKFFVFSDNENISFKQNKNYIINLSLFIQNPHFFPNPPFPLSLSKYSHNLLPNPFPPNLIFFRIGLHLALAEEFMIIFN